VLGRLGAVSFRCLENLALEPVAGTNVIVGDNGAGKTSLLEAIYLLGRGRSFRTANLNTVVRNGQKALAVRGTVEAAERSRSLSLKWVQGRVSAEVDGRAVDGLVELARQFPVEIIDTQVQEIVRGGPGERRRYLDWGVFHVEHSFLDAWRRYSRALKQRNAALRANTADAGLAVWEAELAASGVLLNGARQRYVAALSADLSDVLEDLVGAEVTLHYQRGWADGSELADALARGRDRDMQRGYTGVGPHRADIDIRFDGRPARDHCSGGQQKLIASGLVLAQVRIVGETLGASPVLLIDDPGAEVADSRLDRLMGWVDSLCEQRFVTGLDTDVLGDSADALFHVEHGHVTRVK
jgi:DNA replication and repair protein RecF